MKKSMPATLKPPLCAVTVGRSEAPCMCTGIQGSEVEVMFRSAGASPPEAAVAPASAPPAGAIVTDTEKVSLPMAAIGIVDPSSRTVSADSIETLYAPEAEVTLIPGVKRTAGVPEQTEKSASVGVLEPAGDFEQPIEPAPRPTPSRAIPMNRAWVVISVF